MPSHFITIAKIEDLPPDTCKSIETQDLGIALFHVNGHIYALDNTCPHAGGPLGEGTIEGEHITCPWHGYRFDVVSGACVSGDACRFAARPEIRERDGSVFLESG